SYQDSISWYNSMEYYYVSVGQMSDVIKLMEERWALEEKNATEFMMLGRKLDSEVMKRYISIGRGDEILRLIEEMKGKLKGDRSNYIPYYVVEFYFAQEDYEGFSSVFNKNKSSFQSNMPKEMYKAMLGYEQKFQGNYTEAISILEPIVENSSDWTAKYHLYDAYYQSGQYQKGLDGFNILLERNPIDAKPLLRKSQCLHNLGKREEAKEILAKLEHIFSNADKKYDIYQKMLVFKEQLYLKG
ncbi:MAG: tetratricopeptide repeat protein, partial [Saprospiraceae bacterium]